MLIKNILKKLVWPSTAYFANACAVIINKVIRIISKKNIITILMLILILSFSLLLMICCCRLIGRLKTDTLQAVWTLFIQIAISIDNYNILHTLDTFHNVIIQLYIVDVL